MILVIGDLARWRLAKGTLPLLEDVRFASFLELGPALLEPPPELVLSPLLTDGFDAVEVAQRLQELGYKGRYRALAPAGTAAGVVAEEVRQVAADLDFDLIVAAPPGDAG